MEIKKQRLKVKLLQRQVAKELGITQQTYSKMERNPNKIKVETLRKIAKAINVNLSDFLS